MGLLNLFRKKPEKRPKDDYSKTQTQEKQKLAINIAVVLLILIAIGFIGAEANVFLPTQNVIPKFMK